MSERLNRREFLRLTGASTLAGLLPPGVLAAEKGTAGAGAEKAPGATVHFSELWGEKGERWDSLGRLPDFSYAGYHTGEKPIPDVPVRANVKKFGAKGDSETDDTQAFKQAIAATESGAIFVPEGRYQITDYLIISKPNLVLRGAGRDETTLFFPKSIEQITGQTPYSDGLIRVGPTSEPQAVLLTKVTKGASRGDTTLAVESTAGLRPGQMVRLRMYNPISGEAPEFIDRAAFPIHTKVSQSDPIYNSLGKYLYGGGGELNPERRGWFAGLVVIWLVKVEGVNGNTIKLARPLRLDVRPEWSPEIWSEPPPVEEVGLEDFTMEFPNVQYPGHWKEKGYMGVSMGGVLNCWARRLCIVDADICFTIGGTAHSTISQVSMKARWRMGEPTENTNQGETGHFGVSIGGPPSQDNLVTDCELQTTYVHNLSVGAMCNGNVFSSIRSLRPRFDHHGGAPYDNLYTDILLTKGGDGFHLSGGNRGDEGNSGVRDTYWNIRKLAGTFSGIKGPDRHPQMNIIGVDGLTTVRPSNDSLDTWIESWPGETTVPPNLYEAQLARRLATLRSTRKDGVQ